MNSLFIRLVRSASFAFWSLRRRTGQALPVAMSLFLLIFAAQIISGLQNVSSVLTRREIARNWRGSYDLLVRPQSSVNLVEQRAGWIDPQSMLEHYGGISNAQLANIQALPYITEVSPVATVGWQIIDLLLPVELKGQGIYRISAAWDEKGQADNTVVRYVEVTDLSHLTNELPLASPVVEHVTSPGDATRFIYTLSLQTIQAVIGVQITQVSSLHQAFLENLPPVASHFSLHIERLRSNLSTLPACMKHIDCWIPQPQRVGKIQYQTDGVQLLRYSATYYNTTPQALAEGKIAIAPVGNDTQGPIYRRQLPGDIPVDPIDGAPAQFLSTNVLIYSGAERLPLLPEAMRFIPLAKACAINKPACYSGLYIRMSGVAEYNQRSLALLQSTAAAIAAHTGLHVDILDGSSLRGITIAAQRASSPSQTNIILQTNWRVIGVALQIVHGVDTLQEILFLLSTIVCFLTVVSAGVLVGVGRRKDALLLQQLGWQRSLLPVIFTFDGLFFSVPAGTLVLIWSLMATTLWPGNMPSIVLLLLLIGGILIYCASLVGSSCLSHGKNMYFQAQRTMVLTQLISNLAISSIVFLIAIGYLLIAGFNQLLIVTLLGRQVRQVLEGPQLLLLLVLVFAALLTVVICTFLQLQGRREELALLSKVGWERRDVLLRFILERWKPAFGSGMFGTLLAISVALLISSPPIFYIVSLLVWGPIIGIVLEGIATSGIAWRETGRVFTSWR